MPPAWRRKSDASLEGCHDFVINHTDNDRMAVLAALPMLGALPARLCVTQVARLAKEERRFPTGYYEFVINHTDNDRRAVLAAPGYDVLGERQADGGLLRGRRGVAIVRHS
jgi:hypothetical protein